MSTTSSKMNRPVVGHFRNDELQKCADNFLLAYSEAEARSLVYQLLKYSFTGSISETSPKERSNLFSFYEHLTELLTNIYGSYVPGEHLNGEGRS